MASRYEDPDLRVQLAWDAAALRDKTNSYADRLGIDPAEASRACDLLETVAQSSDPERRFRSMPSAVKAIDVLDMMARAAKALPADDPVRTDSLFRTVLRRSQVAAGQMGFHISIT